MKKHLFLSGEKNNNFITKAPALALAFLLFFVTTNAQVFTGSGGAIQNNGIDTYYSVVVSGLSAPLDSTYGMEEVCLNINHTAVDELYIYLQSPSGRIVQLTAGSSSTGVNYTNTCFNSQASTSVTQVTSPYTGSYRPIGNLGRFNAGQNGNGTWKLIVRDYIASPNSGTLISWNLKFGNNPSKPVTFSSSNLPIVVINTNGQAITENEMVVDMGIIYNGNQRNYVTDSWNEYNGKTRINIRGNTSKNFEKKSFALELQDGSGEEVSAPLLGMPTESDWFLVASYPDKTLLRNQLTYDLYREMGHYSPRTKNVEVIINNEYQGIYALLERPKRDDDRINISKVTATDNFFPAITGGYIFKIDRRDEDGWSSLLAGNSPTNSHFYYQFVYPQDTAITPTQKTYIKDFMDSMETTMNSGYFASTTNGYSKYIKTSSFIDYFIISELSKNIDGYRLSTYLYKENISAGGKLNIGPVWDYDLAWHNCNYGNAFDPAGWEYQLPDTAYPSPTWWSRFMEDQNFKNMLACRWNELRQTLINTSYLNNYIDAAAAVLNEAQNRNFRQWPILGSYIAPNPQTQINTSYQGEVDDLKNWIAARIPWLDAAITGACTSVGIEEQLAMQPDMNGYPNPFTDNLRVSYKVPQEMISNEAAQVKVELLNVLGEPVKLVYSGSKQPGSYEELINTQHLAAGVYIVKLSVNDRVVYQKTTKAG
ncbi:MAG: CotH kinase family protein [Bacteroidia bacterium]